MIRNPFCTDIENIIKDNVSLMSRYVSAENTIIEDMLQMRIDGWNRFNKMFGTNVKVKLSSSWYKIAKDV